MRNPIADRRAASLKLNPAPRANNKLFNLCVFDKPKDDLHIAQFEMRFKKR